MIEAKGNIVGKVSSKQNIKGKINNAVKYVSPSLEDLTVIPSGNKQIFNHPNSYGYDNVVVEAVASEELNITPSTIEQVNEGIFNKVTVAGDSDLLPENIKSGVSIFGVDGTGNVVDFEITDCRYLFYAGSRRYDMGNLLPLCNGENMSYMFNNFGFLIPLDLRALRTSKATNMSYMFSGCSATELDISNFDTSNVTSMFQMFNGVKRPTTLDVSSFNTSKVTTMAYMFTGMTALTTIDVSNFDTSKVTTMQRMFNNTPAITELDISNFDSTKLTDTSYMFAADTKLTKLIIDNPKVFPMTNTNMFTSTPIASGTGYVYVPDDLVDSYKSATNWSTYATQIKGMSELA